MARWASIMRWLEPTETRADQTFSMGNRGSQPTVEETGPKHLAETQLGAEGLLNHIDSLLEAAPKGRKAVEKAGDLSASLDENVERLKSIFRMPHNRDLIIRELQISTEPPTKAVGCYMEGLSDKTIQNEHILKPLMLMAGPEPFSIETLMEKLLPGNQVARIYDMMSISQSLLAGDSVLLFDGYKTAVGMETKGFPIRSVGEPKNEKVIWGPHDAFTEAWRVNVALVRRRLKDPRVVTEILTVGEVSHTFIGMMYIDGLASPKLVAEVKRRVESIKVDVIGGAGVLEQYIEDNPNSLLPGTLVTERPDRTAAYLSEGHVALFVDTSPQAMICPVTFWSLLQTAEDYYLRFPFGTLLRYIRLVALVLSLVVPSVYIAVVNYHQEMIPTELMLFIANSRENVPMPAVVELLLMDLTFELIRESGARIPGVIGPTVGLVASLVLGQAAVSAKIVSPLLVVIVAITGLSSFALPNYMAGFGIRALRFLLLAAATVLGFYGLGAVAFVLVLYLAGMRSFGVPYLAPVAPGRGRITDVLSRPHLYDMEMRPSHIRPLNQRRQADVVRTWDPYAQSSDGKSSEKEDRREP